MVAFPLLWSFVASRLPLQALARARLPRLARRRVTRHRRRMSVCARHLGKQPQGARARPQASAEPDSVQDHTRLLSTSRTLILLKPTCPLVLSSVRPIKRASSFLLQASARAELYEQTRLCTPQVGFSVPCEAVLGGERRPGSAGPDLANHERLSVGALHLPSFRLVGEPLLHPSISKARFSNQFSKNLVSPRAQLARSTPRL
jgi:hypothetical protein